MNELWTKLVKWILGIIILLIIILFIYNALSPANSSSIVSKLFGSLSSDKIAGATP